MQIFEYPEDNLSVNLLHDQLLNNGFEIKSVNIRGGTIYIKTDVSKSSIDAVVNAHDQLDFHTSTHWIDCPDVVLAGETVTILIASNDINERLVIDDGDYQLDFTDGIASLEVKFETPGIYDIHGLNMTDPKYARKLQVL